jgi:hypothetical protein
MPSAKSRTSWGPKWLCLCSCMLWQLPVPVLLATATTGAVPIWYLLLTVPFLSQARYSLRILITGQAPVSTIESSLQMICLAFRTRDGA